MTISADLAGRYSSEVDYDWFEAMELSHPTAGAFWIKNSIGEAQGYLDGVLRTFSPVPFRAILPSRDGAGQQDFKIAICNVDNLFTSAMNSVMLRPNAPITMKYTVYIVGNLQPQYDPPFELAISRPELTEEQFTAVATRTDVNNRPFPYVVYRPDTFPGLNRR